MKSTGTGQCRFPVVLSAADSAEEGSDYHPLLSLAVISQPGLARGQTYYPLISFQISKTLQVAILRCSIAHSSACGEHMVVAVQDVVMLSGMLSG